MITLNKTLRLFLDSIGRRDEYEFYLKKFHKENSSCFALLCPDAESIETAAEALAFDLHFLMRLELIPAIMLCGDNTDTAQTALQQETIFRFETFINLDAPEAIISFIQQSREQEHIPVLVFPSIKIEQALQTLLPSICRRVHFIQAGGGLKSSSGEQLDYLYTHKKNEMDLDPLSVDFIGLGKQLLSACPGTHISVTSPINLLEEVFTVKGAGTVLRKGSQISHYTTANAIEKDKLIKLLEQSFAKSLISNHAFEHISDFYIEENYRGAVLMEPHTAGHYLSKFAVGKEARGEGLAIELWKMLCDKHDSFFWRSNRNNLFNSWYDKQADGRHEKDQWMVFWRGVSSASISNIIEYCSTRSEDFS